jgi:hypothetical protein
MKYRIGMIAVAIFGFCVGLQGDDGATVPVKGSFTVKYPQPIVTAVKLDDGAPAPVAEHPAHEGPAAIEATTDATGVSSKGETPVASEDVPNVPIEIKGPKSIPSTGWNTAAVVTLPKDAKIEWQISPDPGREHREIGIFGETSTQKKHILIFIDAPAGKYTVLALGKIVTPGEDGVGVAWLDTTVGQPEPPQPPDADNDGIPDNLDPCPFDPTNRCNEPGPEPHPTPTPVAFDSAVVVMEGTNVSPEHAVLMRDLAFWRTFANGKFRRYDVQQPEVVAKGYDKLLKDNNVSPPALILFKADGTVAKVGTLPNTKAEVSKFGGK